MMNIIKPEVENIMQTYGLSTSTVEKTYSDSTRKNFNQFCIQNNFSTVEDAGLYLYNLVQSLSTAIEMADAIIVGKNATTTMTFVDDEFENPSVGIFCAKQGDFPD